MAKLNVVVLFGGRSSEHSISCATAAGVLGAINRDKYNVIPVGITQAGVFVPAEDNPARWALTAGELPIVELGDERVEFAMDGSRRVTVIDDSQNTRELAVADVVFPLLHGPFGEDGTMQGFLELAGIPYVGNGVFAGSAGMDKEFSKALFLQAGVPATPHVVIHRNDWMNDPESALEAVRNLGPLPIFVKPARAGSSVGVTKVKSMDDFGSAVALAFEHDSKLTVERGLVGREVELAVLSSRDGGKTRVSCVGEIVMRTREFYDFEAKYRDADAAELVIPTTVTEDELQLLQDLSRRAFAALGGFGLGRVDFFLTKDGPFINEINTMPGFTPISMYPKLWAASGIDYPELIDELIQLGLHRAQLA